MCKGSEQGASQPAPGRRGENKERSYWRGGALEVPVKALAFPWNRIDGNLERIKQEADVV